MMKFLRPPFLLSLLTLSLLTVLPLAHANEEGGHGEAKKEEAPPPEEKKPNYVKEGGFKGRDGYNYKRISRDDKGKPDLAPKKPPPEPEKKEEEKKEEGHGGGHEEPKKEEKEEHGGGEHEAPKKEEKKKDKDKKEEHGGGEHGGGEHGGGHGEHEEKKEKPTPSKVYPLSVIKLNSHDRPLSEPVYTNKYADYFLCRDIVKDDYRETVFNEMNSFADRMGLTRVLPTPCMVKIAKPGTKLPGAVFIEFYPDEDATRACLRGAHCGETRLMMLFPKDKGKHPEALYRSYVLTNKNKLKRGAFCVSPEGQVLADKNCYVVLHPDWLFN